MPHTHNDLPASSGFDSFSVPLKQPTSTAPNSSLSNFGGVQQTRTRSQQPPQSGGTVTWSSSASNATPHLSTTSSLPSFSPGTRQQSFSSQASPYNTTSDRYLTMSAVAGPTSAGAYAGPSTSITAAGSNHPTAIGQVGAGGMSAVSHASNPSGWGYHFPGAASDQMAGNNNSASNNQNATSGGGDYHQYSNSMDGITAANAASVSGGVEQSSFLGHRRMHTDTSLSFNPQNSSYTFSAAAHGDNRDPSGSISLQNSPGPHSTPQSKPFTLGPVRLHQFFPTAGEAGVPVTVLATVSADWARQVGLHLVNGIFGGNDSAAARAYGGSRFVLSFGTTEVEARTERSIATSDSPFTTLTTLEGTAYQTGSHRDLDLTINAYAPTYPGPQLQYPNLGGRVPIRIKLIGAPVLDASLQVLVDGLQVGEFCYWQVSPRSNLKRPGDDLISDQHALRRPASFPAMASNFAGAPAGAMMQQTADSHQQQHSVPHHHLQMSSQTGAAGIMPGTSFRRSGLSDSMGLNRMQSAHDFRSGEANTTMASNAIQLMGAGLDAGQYGGQFAGGSQPYTTNSSPASNKRRTSLSFSGGMGPPSSDLSRPASEAQGSTTPQLIRSTQLFSPTPGPGSGMGGGAPGVGYHSHNHSSVSSTSSSPPTDRSGLPIPSSHRANLELHGNIQDMAVGWSHDEWRSRRRLVQFWRKQEGTTIHAICKPILPEQYVPNSVVVSCIFWDVTNECYITSVDIIYLLEALVASRFNVEEKNRIRRNLEGLKPKTISKIAKSHDEKLNRIHEEFFKLVMSFPNPKPRHIEKDIKIFPWRVLSSALNKIISKYSAAPLVAAAAAATSHPMAGVNMNAQTTPMLVHPPSADPSISSSSMSSGQQHDPRRMHAPGLSIDIGMSNSAFHGGGGGAAGGVSSSSNSSSQGQSNTGSTLSYPGLGTPGRGLGIGLMPSPRKSMSGGLGLPGSSTFNFSDFVVSPSAFGQTPLQQAQSLHGSGNNVGGTASSSSHGHGSGGGLGMDLGSVYKHDQ